MNSQPIEPVIVVCYGPPCSGKSTVAELLANRLNDAGIKAQHLSVDSILTEILPESDRNVHDRTLAINVMHQRAQTLFHDRQIVVLDSTYTRYQARKQLEDVDGSPKTDPHRMRDLVHHKGSVHEEETPQP